MKCQILISLLGTFVITIVPESPYNSSGQDFLELTIPNCAIWTLAALRIVSMHHHATDLSEMFIAWCATNTHPRFHMTAIYSGASN